MKTIKRVLSVLLLIVLMTVVGYLVFTGNRLPSVQQEQSQNSTQEGGFQWIDENELSTELQQAF